MFSEALFTIKMSYAFLNCDYEANRAQTPITVTNYKERWNQIDFCPLTLVAIMFIGNTKMITLGSK